MREKGRTFGANTAGPDSGPGAVTLSPKGSTTTFCVGARGPGNSMCARDRVLLYVVFGRSRDPVPTAEGFPSTGRGEGGGYPTKKISNAAGAVLGRRSHVSPTLWWRRYGRTRGRCKGGIDRLKSCQGAGFFELSARSGGLIQLRSGYVVMMI